jgi:flagellar basal-body rod protein FlgG
MDRGLYIAATGMLSAVTRQDVIASNLANVNTVGYKADRVANETFSDLFLTSMKTGQRVGTMNLGTRVAETITDYAQGALRNTGTKLDLAITGDGFFAVNTAQGTRYTRNGQFSKSADGFLTTANGDYVLSTARQPIFVGSGDPTITADGTVFTSDGQLSGQIAVVTLNIPEAKKVGENYWSGEETGGRLGTTFVRQGFLEASGVNSIKEMVEMITTMRAYESSQRVVMAIDSTLDKAVNQVGPLQ